MVGTSAIVAFRAKIVDGASQGGNRADDHGASWHLDLLCWWDPWREAGLAWFLRLVRRTYQGPCGTAKADKHRRARLGDVKARLMSAIHH